EPRTVSKAKKDVEKATGQNAGRPDRAGRQGLGDHPSGTRDLLLDAREGARPGLARPHLLGKSVDGVLGGLLVGEAAGGDHEQRLALMDLAIVAVVAAQLADEVPRRLLGTHRQDLQRVALARLDRKSTRLNSSH